MNTIKCSCICIHVYGQRPGKYNLYNKNKCQMLLIIKRVWQLKKAVFIGAFGYRLYSYIDRETYVARYAAPTSSVNLTIMNMSYLKPKTT